MIDRKRFGKKLGQRRRALGLSQKDLAERLGVTAQAVSKWEVGQGMADIELLLALSKLFGTTVNALLGDEDPIAAMGTGVEAKDGVYDFLAGRKPRPDDSFGRYTAKERLSEKSWLASRAEGHPFSETGKRIAEAGGLILEIGAGPGGGFMPLILKADPNAAIVVSDLSPGVVREWKRVLDSEAASPNLRYAVCDFTDLPFPDGSFDTVSDCGGIGNTVGSPPLALKEAFRVLKPGGILVSFNCFVGEDSGLSDEVRRILRSEYPCAFRDLYAETVNAGFRRIECEIVGVKDTDRDDSGFAARCRELGVNVRRTGYVRFCTKPERD